MNKKWITKKIVKYFFCLFFSPLYFKKKDVRKRPEPSETFFTSFCFLSVAQTLLRWEWTEKLTKSLKEHGNENHLETFPLKKVWKWKPNGNVKRVKTRFRERFMALKKTCCVNYLIIKHFQKLLTERWKRFFVSDPQNENQKKKWN